jgi:hypothetical protein
MMAGRGSGSRRGRATRVPPCPTPWAEHGLRALQVVSEVRVAEGSGARWGNDGEETLGFLEPFTAGFPLVRD